MEDIITKVLASLKMPTIIVAISTIVFKLLTFLPVTFVTAKEFEKKFYTKEQRLLHQIVHFIFSMIVITIFMVLIGDYFADNNHWYNQWFALSGLIYVILFFYLIFWMATDRKKITDVVSRRRRGVFLLSTGIYFVLSIALTPYSIGSTIGNLYKTKSGSMPINYLLIFVMILFICSAFTVVLLKPLNRVLAFKTEKVVSIEMDKGGKKEKWYLLHPVKADSYLIGDHYMPEVCKKNRIITKDSLFEKEFSIENLDDLRKGSSQNKKKVWIQL